MTNDLISIISPIYKTEKFLKKCIKSVLNQTYANFELIMISDASPDNSVEIVKTFQEQDSRIKLLINQQNLGLSHTRFEGMKIARGEYILHLDSDDWLPHNTLEVLHKKITQENADVVYGAFTRVIDKVALIRNKKKNNYSTQHITKTVHQPELFDDYYISYFGVNKLFVSMWGKLYRKSVIDIAELKPTTMTMGEDLLYNMHLHPFLKKIAFVEDVVYYYRWGGMTNKQNPTFLQDIKQQYRIKKNKLEQYNYYQGHPFIKHELVNCFYSHFLNNLLLNKCSKNKIRELITEELRDVMYSQELKDIYTKKALNIYHKRVDILVEQVWAEYTKAKTKYQIKRLINALMS